MSDEAQPKYATAADLERILEERERAAQQRPAQAARADFIAQQQARPFDGLDGVPPEYLKGIGDDPARWPQEVKRARLTWLFDTGKASSSEAMQLGLMNTKPARETPTSTLTLNDFTGGGGPNRAA
jgi:hypothetical protein